MTDGNSLFSLRYALSGWIAIEAAFGMPEADSASKKGPVPIEMNSKKAESELAAG